MGDEAYEIETSGLDDTCPCTIWPDMGSVLCIGLFVVTTEADQPVSPMVSFLITFSSSVYPRYIAQDQRPRLPALVSILPGP